MKKLSIIGLIIFIIGALGVLVTFASNDFDFIKISGCEQKSYDSDQSFNSVNVNFRDMSFEILQSQDQKLYIDYTVSKNQNVAIEIKDGVLNISDVINKKWYEEVFNFNFVQLKMKIMLPNNFSGSVSVKSQNGSVKLNNLQNLADVKAELNNGAINLSGVSANSVVCKTSNGSINLDNFTISNNINLESSNGKINLTNVKSKTSFLKTKNGNIYLNNCSLTDEINAYSNAGSINFTSLESKDISLETNLGSINGNIKGDKTQYNIDTKCSNGNSNLTNQVVSTSNKLKAITHCGNIKISFVSDNVEIVNSLI